MKNYTLALPQRKYSAEFVGLLLAELKATRSQLVRISRLLEAATGGIPKTLKKKK